METVSANAPATPQLGRWAALATYLIALFCSLALAGCSESDRTGGPDNQPANPLLYELANADGEVEGWLLGTIHALPDDVEWRTPQIKKVIRDADLLMVEVAELENSREVAAIFARLSTTRGLPPLADRVGPELRTELETMIARSNRDAQFFDDTEDWAAAILLSHVDAVGDPRNGVDRELIGEFSGRGVQGFETAEEQLGIFDQLAPRDQTDLLEGTVREWVISRAHPGRLMRAWLAGDLTKLEEATTTGIMADPELREALLVQRNKRWLPVLEETFDSDAKPLVAVGAAHIVGPEGLVTMLSETGIAARRIN